jgi:hypothetical protein
MTERARVLSNAVDGRSLGRDFGFRRVDCVRVVVDGVDGGLSHAEVTGVVHRYPRTVSVPMRVAARLVAGGAPLVVQRDIDRKPNGKTGR